MSTTTTEKTIIQVWAARTMAAPEIGDEIRNPLGWLTDEFGGDLDSYVGPENMPEKGTVVEIGEYRDGGYCVAVEVEVAQTLADAIDPKDIHE